MCCIVLKCKVAGIVLQVPLLCYESVERVG
jgi:hypothetical protein